MYLYVCNYKKCTHPSIFNKYCRKHYNIFFNKYALTIQKNYRRYKINKKVINIYSKLPDDIQNKIKKYMNVDIEYRKYKNTINTIINKKIIKYFFYNNFNFSLNEISYHISLLHKYYNIININILKYFYKLLFEIKLIIVKILDQDIVSVLNILDYNFYSFTNRIIYKDIDNHILRECLYNIVLYQNVYEKHYKII